MLAYLQINDPELRKQVVRLAEKYAGHPQPVLLPNSVEQDNATLPAADPTEDVAPTTRPELDPPQ
jgi:hypothetical protein